MQVAVVVPLDEVDAELGDQGADLLLDVGRSLGVGEVEHLLVAPLPRVARARAEHPVGVLLARGRSRG